MGGHFTLKILNVVNYRLKGVNYHAYKFDPKVRGPVFISSTYPVKIS